jgi:hypothetical protein
LILILRWNVSLPALVAEDLGIVEALKRSCKLTAGRWKTVAGIYGIVLVTYLPPMMLLILVYPEHEPSPWPAAIAANLMISVGFVVLWLLGAALYRRLRLSGEEAEGLPARD